MTRAGLRGSELELEYSPTIGDCIERGKPLAQPESATSCSSVQPAESSSVPAAPASLQASESSSSRRQVLATAVQQQQLQVELQPMHFRSSASSPSESPQPSEIDTASPALQTSPVQGGSASSGARWEMQPAAAALPSPTATSPAQTFSPHSSPASVLSPSSRPPRSPAAPCVPVPPSPLAHGPSFGSPVSTLMQPASAQLPPARARPRSGNVSPAAHASAPILPAARFPRPHSAPRLPQPLPTGRTPLSDYSRPRRPRRDERRCKVRLGAERPRSGSATRHPPAAFGPSVRSPGSLVLRATRSNMEMASQDYGDASAMTLPLDESSSQLGTLSYVPTPAPPTGVAAVSAHTDSVLRGAASLPLVAEYTEWMSARQAAPHERPRQPVHHTAQARSPWDSRSPCDMFAGSSMLSESLPFLHELLDEGAGSEAAAQPQRRGSAPKLRGLHASRSKGDMTADGNTLDGVFPLRGSLLQPPSCPAALDTCNSLTEVLSEMIPMATPEESMREVAAAQTAPLGRGRDRGRYLRLLCAGAAGGDGARGTARKDDLPLGMPSLRFKTYEFPMAREFTFSDGQRIQVPADSRPLR